MYELAVEAVQDGRIIGLPTDTVYGLAVDPLNQDAVSALYDAKGRPEHKPLGLLVASVEDAGMIADLHGYAAELAEMFWPGALTLVVAPKVILSDWVGDRQRLTIGIRVPGYEPARDVLALTGPLAVTSANRSGQPDVSSESEAQAIFGDEVAHYVPGRAPGGMPSTVVDATGFRPSVIRQGAIEIPA